MCIIIIVWSTVGKKTNWYQLFVRIAILLTRGKNLVSRGISSMTGHVWVMQTSLTTPLFIFKCQNHPRIERVSIYPLVSVTLLEHLSSPPVFSEVRFTRSLVLCACFVYICPFVLFHWHFMTVQTVWYILFFTLWQFERCGILFFSFFDSSNGVVYFDFHFMTVRAVWYILFLSYDSSNGVVYFVFHFYDSSNGVEYFSFHFMTVRTVWNIFLFILCQFERCGILFFSFLTVRTVWYILISILWQFERCGIFCF